MFGFGKKKKVDTNSVEAFDSAMKAIEIFMSLSEWSKANKALDEIEKKEKESLDYIVDKLSKKTDHEGINQKEIEKLKKVFKEKKEEIDKLRAKLKEEERLYNKKIEDDRFKIRFEKIKEEVDNLVGKKEVDAALSILKKFLEENADNTSVVKFYNTEKKKVLKAKEKVDKEKEEKIKKDAETEAMNLIGKTINIDEKKDEKKQEQEEKKSFFQRLKEKLQFAKNIKERIERKKLLDEINLLIEEDSKIKNEIASKKLANIHKTLTKEIDDTLEGYELYGKILSADKIAGDSFGFKENGDKYNFYIGDATGNGLRAGFIITILNRLFNKYIKNNLAELTYEINNGLKQDLKSRNFITGIFFEILKENVSKIKFVGMGHVPIYIYRKETQKAEQIVAGGLAAGIRLIKHPADIKVRELDLKDGDILLTYSDGIVENKNSSGEMYGFDRLEKAFTEISQKQTDITKIYDYIINDIKKFKGSESFDDDATAIIIKRDKRKDIVDKGSEYLSKIQAKEGLNNNEIRKLKGKSIEDIEKELEVLKKKKETERIIKILEGYYYTGEILRLKQEAIRYIKEGYIDKKINDYLKKAINNEKAYKIKQKNQRAKNKYEILEELLKKGDYDTVIKEAEEIISSDGEL